MNAKELILAKVNAGNKLAKMYLFLITVGMNINDIVTFMTSPVASFIDTITEENVYSGSNISIPEAIKFARGMFMNKGELLPSYVKKYGLLKMLQIKNAYEKAGLNDQQKMKEIIADCDEFANILEGADEFSNFGRLLGFNLGLPTSKVELLQKMSFILKIYAKRLDQDSSAVDKASAMEFYPLNIEKWVRDSNYRQLIAKEYDKVKKCINVFDAFTHIEQFDAIRDLFDTVITIDANLSFKSRAFDTIFKKISSLYSFVSEKYLNNILREIDKIIITNFIKDLNISIPVLKGTNYLQSGNSLNTFKENGMLYLDNMDAIKSFKYIFENNIVPQLKLGIVTEVDSNGNIINKKYSDLASNVFISALLRTNELNIPFYKVNLNMLTIKDSTESLKRFLMYSNGLLELSKYKIGDYTLADLFMLYNLIVNRNLYGASRLTTLFESFINRGLSIQLLSKYFDYLGNLDYFGVPRLSTDSEFDPSKYSKNTPIIDINYKDVMIGAASTVKSTKGQLDPFIIQLTDLGPIIMEKSGFSYSPVLQLLIKEKNEDLNHYLERLNNERSYSVLGGRFSDYLLNQLHAIQELKDTEKIISYINNFVRDGLLTISKVCK